jgi:putative ABC transport system permease protein
MFRYFIKHYLRSISRRKLFSFINITGLAFAIAFLILIGQFIFYEFNYNHSLKDLDRIYRVINENDETKNYELDYRIKDLISENVSGVDDICILNKFSVELNVEDKVFQKTALLITDNNFFRFFGCTFINGNSSNALTTLDGVVITENLSKSIFGMTNAVGKTIRINHKDDMIITGIIKDLPDNLSFNAQIFASFENTAKQKLVYKMYCLEYDGSDDSKCRYPFNFFVKLNEKANVSEVEKQIAGFNARDDFKFPGKVSLASFSDNYFYREINDDDLIHGNVELIKILSIIGIAILLLAVINFFNLATASYKYRLTEISVKKCFGADRKSLVRQLFFESLFTTFISGTLGIAIAELLLPYFNRFVEKPLELQFFTDPLFVILFVAFLLLLSLMTGFFPAVILSRISPLQLFKFNPVLIGTGKNSRGILTSLQFAITIILITGLVVINSQIDYVKHKDLGFNTNQLIYMKIHHTLNDRVNILSDKLQQFPNIKSFTKSLGIPGDVHVSTDNYDTIVIDSTFIETFGFKVINGRNLLPGDFNKSCLINAEALKNFKDGDYSRAKINGSDVVGVVSDFTYSSLHKRTSPLVLLYSDWNISYLTIRIAGNITNTLEYLKNIWKETCPEYPLQFSFYNDHFASMYKKEENLASLVSIFSILAIVISCMGIFGLSVFQSEQRIKEIGIRKVLGATTSEIVFLLTKSFSKWVIFANVIAIPIAYYFLDEWLQEFAYKIEINWWMFALAGGIALVIALLTISIQAIRAATANPVKSLRYE